MISKFRTYFVVIACATLFQTLCFLLCLWGFYYDHVLLTLVTSPLLFCKILVICSIITSLSITYVLKGGSRIHIKALIKSLFQLVILTLLSASVFHSVLVLFGAAITSVVLETFHLSCLLVATVILPCAILNWPNVFEIGRIFFCDSDDSMVGQTLRTASFLSLFGCWLGAFPIPLDWDRPWQTWPVTCVIGTFCGSTLGLPVGCLYSIYLKQQEDKMKIV